MTPAVQMLIDRFGSAEAVLVWAEQTATDLRSEFDLTDDEFDQLKAMSEDR